MGSGMKNSFSQMDLFKRKSDLRLNQKERYNRNVEIFKSTLETSESVLKETSPNKLDNMHI